MNFTPSPLKHDWNVRNALNNVVVGSSVASGIVSDVVSPVAPDAPEAPEAPVAPSLGEPAVAVSETGRIAPLPSLVTFHPSGS
jgi:hypothetical protein